jgi:uncharacterized lipoprotein YehR (DUF1307 family)
LDNFEAEANYLVKSLDKTPRYDEEKKHIYSLINFNRERVNKMIKQKEEREKNLKGIYEEAKLSDKEVEESLIDAFSKLDF